MSKAEKFISDCTRNCSNENGGWNDGDYIQIYQHWPTPDQARKAVEIAREEMIEKMQDWIADTFQYDGSNDFNGGSNDVMSLLLENFTEYIKQVIKDE